MSESKRVVVVTGGSKGIGRSICLRFAEEGARVVFAHYDPDEGDAKETHRLLSEFKVEARSEKVDVSSFEGCDTFFKTVTGDFGRIDVLVNNAGITRDSIIMRMTEHQWDQVIQVNLKSVFNCTKAAARTMVKQKEGRIVNISSVAGLMGNAGQANYAASKAGITGFTKSVARELAGRGITVNAVAPGFINTEMTRRLPEKAKEAFLSQIPAGRIGEPGEVAEAVYWLASQSAAYITGQVIHVNGGIYM